MHLTVVLRLRPPHSHLISVVAMKGVAANDHCVDAFTAKDVLKGRRYGRRACARRTCDRNDRIFGRHVSPLERLWDVLKGCEFSICLRLSRTPDRLCSFAVNCKSARCPLNSAEADRPSSFASNCKSDQR